MQSGSPLVLQQARNVSRSWQELAEERERPRREQREEPEPEPRDTWLERHEADMRERRNLVIIMPVCIVLAIVCSFIGFCICPAK